VRIRKDANYSRTRFCVSSERRVFSLVALMVVHGACAARSNCLRQAWQHNVEACHPNCAKRAGSGANSTFFDISEVRAAVSVLPMRWTSRETCYAGSRPISTL